MSNKRIIYVPWERSEAGSLAQKAQTFLENAPKAPLKPNKEPKAWEVVYFVPERDWLSALQMLDQIYVIGHGLNGRSDVTTGDGERARFELVCNRLQANGLQKTFAGKIKFYSCFGAVEFDGGIGRESFAGKAARLLRERGFKQCRIFGYGAVVTNPDESGKKRLADDSWASEKRHEFGPNGEVVIPPKGKTFEEEGWFYEEADD